MCARIVEFPADDGRLFQVNLANYCSIKRRLISKRQHDNKPLVVSEYQYLCTND